MTWAGGAPRGVRPAPRNGVIALTVFLSAYNNVLNLFRPTAASYVAANTLTAAGLLAAGRRLGLDAEALGVGRRQLPSAARWSAAALAVIGAALGGVAAHPRSRRLLDDRRAAGVDRRQALAWLGLRIPLGTVLLEEVAFRGVLYGVLATRSSPAAAAAGSSVVFGVWHVLPALQTLQVNAPDAGARAKVAAVAGAGAATTGVGLVLCAVRRASGGLVAPAVAHLAANTLFAAAAIARHRRH